MLRVLVADADERRRQSLTAVLRAEPDLELLSPAANRAEVDRTPGSDVVLLVGALDARDAATVLAARRPDGSAWVALVPHGVDTDAVLAAGAHGCLVESSSPVQIVAAIRAAARDEYADPSGPVTGPLVQRMRRTVAELTEREVEVLRLVDAGLANQEIAERLYLSLSSVKSHLSHTYGRLGVNRRSAAAAEARRQGLI